MASVLITGANASDWLQGDETIASGFAALGHLVTDNVACHHDVSVYFNLSYSFWSKHRHQIKTDNPKILVVTEPSVVSPENFNGRKRRYFDTIIEVGRASGQLNVVYPQLLDLTYFEEDARQNRIVAISGNKWSFVKGELYSLRLACYLEFLDLDLFGPRWDKKLVSQPLTRLKELFIAIQGNMGFSFRRIHLLIRSTKNWLGPCKNKLETLSKYKLSLVVENSQEYVSEKLLDCLMAGTIPIYLGGDFKKFGIPEHLVISVEPDLDSVRCGISKGLSMDYVSWKQSARNWFREERNRLSTSSDILRDLIIKETLLLTKL